MSVDYLPRQGFVLVRREARKQLGKIAISDKSTEATRWIVVAVPLGIKDSLQPGDEIMIVGQADEVIAYPIPTSQNLVIVKEGNIGLIIRHKEDPPVETTIPEEFTTLATEGQQVS